MTHFIIDPEVAGGLGEGSELDVSVHPPIVHRLHIQVEGWQGDDLVQTFPCYLVTDRLMKLLVTLDPSGVGFTDAVTTASAELLEREPPQQLPKLLWLRVSGRAGVDDFGLTSDGSLVVSGRVLDAMKSLQLRHCDAKPFSGGSKLP